jgi:hypothetical protein
MLIFFLSRHILRCNRIEVRWYRNQIRAGVIPCDILIPHIDRVKIIDNERPGANPCDLLLVSVRVL